MPKVNCSELAATIARLALNIGTREGVKGIDDIVAVIAKEIPELNRAEVVRAINEYTAAGPRVMTDAQKAARAIRTEAKQDATLRAQAAELQRHLREGTLPTRTPRPDRATEAIKTLREMRDHVAKQVNASDPAVQKRLLAQIDSLTERLENVGDAPEIKPPVKMTKEAERLAYQRDRLRGQIRARINALKPRGFWGHAVEPINLARAVMTSMDFSAVLRQGGFVAFGNPVRAAKALGPMFRAFASPVKAHAINEAVLNRPNAPLYARSKLYLAPLDETARLTAQEEALMSRLAGKIPGVAGSQRAYSTFLNVLRADSFDAMTATLAKGGEVTVDEATAIAKFINVATGRGGLGKFENAAEGLNTIFFAPRYVTSRFQLLAGTPMWKAPGRARALMAKEYAKYLAGMATVYMLGKMAGAELEFDPRSSDFGKLKFGDTRLDPLSGLAQTTTLIGRLVTGQTKNAAGKVKPIRGDVPFGQGDSADVIQRFLRSKLSPAFGTAVDLAAGENVVGEKVTLGSAAVNMVTPMNFKEIYDVMREEGIPEGAAAGALSIFGMGLQNYKDKR